MAEVQVYHGPGITKQDVLAVVRVFDSKARLTSDMCIYLGDTSCTRVETSLHWTQIACLKGVRFAKGNE
jgi:hypothetical protein